MSSQINAVGFYGDTYGQEGNLSDYNLIVKINDQLYAGTYTIIDGKKVSVYEQPVPEWSQEFITWFDHPVSILEPSILVLYTESFLERLEELPELANIHRELKDVPRVPHEYYVGFLTSSDYFIHLDERISILAEAKLRYLFNNLDTEKVKDYENYFYLWKDTTVSAFSTVENLALLAHWDYLTTGHDGLSFYKVHTDRIDPVNGFEAFVAITEGLR